ncbi:hypothetical protein [Amycolatopsis jejuensis]|uniref:hypothetical protein n=1 Tax=Amycolatopsis jejuensis TaxID=330084 RepID=UPI000524D318|nr:hypothetical protein [Amycolatopsis jejuensis]
MDGFQLDPGALTAAAASVGRVSADQDNFALRGLCGDVGLYGHAWLHDELMDFCVRWSDGIDLLAADAESVADLLREIADAYAAVDVEKKKSLTVERS